MPREPKWRKRFRQHFGVTPDQREREKFLRHVAFDGGSFVWRGPAGYAVNGKMYDPAVIGAVMLSEPVRVVSRATV